MRVAAVALAFALYGASALAWTEPSSFEGIPWGASPVEAMAIATARGDNMRCYDVSFCWGIVDIGSVRAEAWYVFIDTRVGRVQLKFDPKDYALLKQAIIDRYGFPTLERTSTQGSAMTEWRGQRVMISLSESSTFGGLATLLHYRSWNLWHYKSLDRHTNSPPLSMRRLMSP